MVMLAMVAAIGGFLFGYDTGVISGALPYLRDDLLSPYKADASRLNWLQGIVVSAAVVGAAVGAAGGGWISDLIGRKTALLVGDVLFALGAGLMAAARTPRQLIAGRALVGLGVGLASVTVPVYIAESAGKSVRATLVTLNVLMITMGQFSAYLVDWLCTFLPGNWRWMLGVAAVPAVLQAASLLFLPESPRWLAAHGQLEQAQAVLRSLRRPEEADADVTDLGELTRAEKAQPRQALAALLQEPEVQAELRLGIGLQILQQLVGINTIMYFTPAILELAGFRDKRTALLVAMLPAGVNAVGTLAGMWSIDRMGRRKLLLASLACVSGALAVLGLAFHLAEGDSPQGCTFCGPVTDELGAGVCMLATDACPAAEPALQAYSVGCPSGYMGMVLGSLLLYLAAFSPGVGPVPWAVNAEIYPSQVRGLASGAAATANWLANAIVSQTFLVLTQHLGGSGTFWMYTAVSLGALLWVFHSLPETNGVSCQHASQYGRAWHPEWAFELVPPAGLSLEEVQQLFRARASCLDPLNVTRYLAVLPCIDSKNA
eukprot:jgi/Astpho2/3905/Aster-04413